MHGRCPSVGTIATYPINWTVIYTIILNINKYMSVKNKRLVIPVRKIIRSDQQIQIVVLINEIMNALLLCEEFLGQLLQSNKMPYGDLGVNTVMLSSTYHRSTEGRARSWVGHTKVCFTFSPSGRICRGGRATLI